MARCTIVIPAYNAAGTIGETIDSVRAQTTREWSAIVVNDHSADDMAPIVGAIEASDSRVRLVENRGRGVASARNTGIASATTELICFLDADDLLVPRFLELLTARLADDRVTAAYCGWQRLAPDGSLEDGPCPDVDGDLFDLFAAACVFPPHACVVRRTAVLEAGGFDERPSTTEDWDLWQKVARTGARFVRVREPLAIYRMRPGSRSRDFSRVLEDGLRVIAAGHATDPRVRHPDPQHASGSDPALQGVRAFSHASWAAGMALASGGDPRLVLPSLTAFTAPDLDPWVVAGSMLEAMRVTLCVPPAQGIATVTPHLSIIHDFLRALEAGAHAPGLAARAARAMDTLLLQQGDMPGDGALLVTFACHIDLERPLPDVIHVPEVCERVLARISYGGDTIGEIELHVAGSQVPGTELADAIAREHHWELLGRFLARTVHPLLEMEDREDGLAVTRRGNVIATGLPRDPARRETALRDKAGWLLFMQELLDVPHLTLDDLYSGRLGAEGHPAAPVESEYAFDVAAPRQDVMSPAAEIHVQCTVAGLPLVHFTMPASGLVKAGVLSRAAIELAPTELATLVAREGLVGRPIDDGVPLRERLRQRLAGAKESAERA